MAGTGGFGSGGDGGPATDAELFLPTDVAADGNGNLYITTFGDRVRKVDSDGIITTVVGTGDPGSGGDGGPATEAQLDNPLGVSVDGDGELYIADFNNHRVRKVDSDGIITTVVGSGQAGFSGDEGPAIDAQLNEPASAVVNEASLYIADSRNARIRKVDSSGTITTVAGGGDPEDGIGDGGLATQAQLDYPTGVAVRGDGTLYIADQAQHRVRRADPSGSITTEAGGGDPEDGVGDGLPPLRRLWTAPEDWR